MVTLNRADVCDAKRQENEVTQRPIWHELHEWKREGKGVSQMDSCLVIACVVVVGCFLCICIEHGKSILVMLGLQSDERDH